MTTALALLSRPIIISNGDKFRYSLAVESAIPFVEALENSLKLHSKSLQELEFLLSVEIPRLYRLKQSSIGESLSFNGYYGFRLNGSEAKKIQAINHSLKVAGWQY